MESRSVYLGIATRLRGLSSGALDRVYLHSPVTYSLYCAVTETESHLLANLIHGVMRAALYGNPMTDVKDGNEKIPQLFKMAMKTVPYVKFSEDTAADGTDGLIEEWKRANAELSSGKKEADGVRG